MAASQASAIDSARWTMQMHQIRYFLALCEERNFTRAARRCGVSQPSLTNAIIGLERKCLREDHIGGRGRRTVTDPTIETGAVNLRGSPAPQHMHALGARWLLGSARPRENTDPELRAASGFPE